MTRVLLITSLLAVSLVSVEQEIDIGKQANAQMRKQVPELQDAPIGDYVRRVGRALAAHAGGPKYPYTFSVANQAEINAFALPGGPVWIHRGVLHAAANESQLAAVVAHEIAHISQRHAAEQLTNAAMAGWGLGVLGALLGNAGGATTARVAAQFLANGIFLQFSREAEREADRAGLRMLVRAGWDARGMVELFEILRREQKREPGRVATFLSTHPSATDRIERLRRSVATARSGRRDSAAFRAMKARALKLPRPKPVARPTSTDTPQR
jgi:predicted Zn-dependent protease